MLSYICRNEDDIARLFGTHLDQERYRSITDLYRTDLVGIESLPKFCGITYIAPVDASKTSKTNLETGSVDVHTSSRGFEHIQPEMIKKILVEGGRLVKDTGIFRHHIDYSDHFAHTDRATTLINFLQYSDRMATVRCESIHVHEPITS